MPSTSAFAATVIVALLLWSPAYAWGDLGHRVTALIAYRHLNPDARSRLDSLLASDPDPLTASDFASRATWADKFSATHHETTPWHFMNNEIDSPDAKAACYGFQPLAEGVVASAGPAKSCIVAKIEQFSAELRDPATTPNEKVLALKFLIHFMGDLHQPLHVADHDDRGGNCIRLSPSPDGDVTNLHLFWDITTVRALGADATTIAAALDKEITARDAKAWRRGDVRTWARETFELAKRDAYHLPSLPTCGTPDATIALSPDYEVTAQVDAAGQLKKAGIRLASVLNADLGVQPRGGRRAETTARPGLRSAPVRPSVPPR
jgi:hypothetical protein